MSLHSSPIVRVSSVTVQCILCICIARAANYEGKFPQATNGEWKPPLYSSAPRGPGLHLFTNPSLYEYMDIGLCCEECTIISRLQASKYEVKQSSNNAAAE